jgi:hypothetical protein
MTCAAMREKFKEKRRIPENDPENDEEILAIIDKILHSKSKLDNQDIREFSEEEIKQVFNEVKKFQDMLNASPEEGQQRIRRQLGLSPIKQRNKKQKEKMLAS